MAREHDGAVELVDKRRQAGTVVRDPPQEVRRRENGVTVAVELVKHGRQLDASENAP
jgi:hypothetical protein